MTTRLRAVWPLLLALAACDSAEKQTATPQAHHDQPITEADIDMPKTYAEAIDRVGHLRDQIRAACDRSTPEEAHRSLDELDMVLAKLPAIARDSGVARTSWEAVNLTARELRASFDSVHSEIDAGRKPDFQQVAQAVESGLEQLRQFSQDEMEVAP